MVALNAQFTILATFCSLAALSLGPTSVNAAAIQKPVRSHTPIAPLPLKAMKQSATGHSKSRKDKQHKARLTSWSPFNSVIRLADLKLGKKKRYYKRDRIIVDAPLVDVILDGGNEDQHHFHNRRSIVIPDKHGASYYVSSSHRSLDNEMRASGSKRHIVAARDQGGVPGRVDIMSSVPNSNDGKKIASLFLEKVNNVYYFNASNTNSTGVYLVSAPSPNPSAQSTEVDPAQDVPVTLQVPMYSVQADAGALTAYCTTYNVKDSSAGPMILEPCTYAQPSEPAASDIDSTQSHLSDAKKSQVFAYDAKTGVIRPFWYKGVDDGKTDTVSSKSATERTTSGVNGRDGPGAQNVTLMFVPSAPLASVKDVADASTTALTSTATLTTTVTVTGTAAPSSISAQDVDLTSSVPTSTGTASGTATPSITAQDVELTSDAPTSTGTVATSTGLSSAASVTPTQASAGALNVQVVGPSSPSSSAAAESSATPTASLSAEDVAQNIAASPSASTTDAAPVATSTASATTDVSSSPTTAVAAAMENSETVTSSSTDSSAAPSMTPVSTAPYKWMFKAEQRL